MGGAELGLELESAVGEKRHSVECVDTALLRELGVNDVAVFDGVLTTTELENARDFGAVNFGVPEPSTSLLLGLTGLALLRRRR